MNKRILISLSIIGVVAAVGIGGTIAYFNDTETSTGNIFVAGTLDLKVDHVLQTYNDVYCKTCSVEIKSDTSNQVVWTDVGVDPVAMPHDAVEVSSPHSAWTVTGDIPEATWIWATDPTLQGDTTQDVYYTFQKTFEWWGPVDGITLSLGVGTDNGYRVELNGDLVGEDMSEFNYQSPADTYSGFGSYLEQGQNTLEITVKNKGMSGGTPTTNPAGLLYKLVIDGDCDNNYFKNHCTLWGEKDLEDETFFNFDDVKPGDRGTNVISLHAFDNDAWACLIVGNKTDAENGVTDPEEKLNDQGEPGELSQNINVFGWTDNDQNGLYEPGSEVFLFSGSLAGDPVNLVIADSTHGSKLIASNPVYVGLAWCAGTQIVDQQTGAITCDGSGMGDIAQSDSFTADITAYIEQWRNNLDFDCDNVNLEQ